MDNGAFNHKPPPKVTGLTRSAINNNFTLAPNGVNGRRFSCVEPSGSSSGGSDISSGSSRGEIRISIPNRTTHGHQINVANHNRGFDHRWSIDSHDKLPPKRHVIDKKGHHISTNLLANVNDTNNKYFVADKAKWTHKSPINGNISV